MSDLATRGPATLINIVMTIVLGGALLYLLNRLRTVEAELRGVRDAIRHTANMEDVVDMTCALIEKHSPPEQKKEKDHDVESEESEDDADHGEGEA